MTRKTLPGTNWRVFWQSITLLSSSSKTPGKATGSVSDWTDVRSLARRKSKWSMGGCGALRRCGCPRTYEGTQFLCVKFRLGSAGEPTICIHCYDVLNEDLSFHVDRPSHSWDTAISKFETGNSRSRSELKVTTWVQHSVDSQPFFSCQSGIPFLSYDFFKIWPWTSRVRVMGEVIVQSHNVGLTSYRLTSLLFHVNRPSHSKI